MRQRGVFGFVLVQFRLEDDGRPRDPRVVLAEPRGAFEYVVLTSVRRLRLKVSPDWPMRHPNRIVEMTYLFHIEHCARVDPKAFPGIDTIIVGTRLSRPTTDKVGCRPPGEP